MEVESGKRDSDSEEGDSATCDMEKRQKAEKKGKGWGAVLRRRSIR